MNDNMDDISLSLEANKIKHYSDDLDSMFVKKEEVPTDSEIEDLMRPVDDIRTTFSRQYIKNRSVIITIHDPLEASEATKKAQIGLKRLVEEESIINSAIRTELMKQILEFPNDVNKNRNVDYQVSGYDDYDEIPVEEIIKKVA